MFNQVRPEVHDEVIKLLVETDPETADDLLKAMSNDMGYVLSNLFISVLHIAQLLFLSHWHIGTWNTCAFIQLINVENDTEY